MIEISTDLIEEAIYNLCFQANTCLDKTVYSQILEAYENAESQEALNILKSILKNAQIAYKTKRSLCQDTGEVIVFLKIGQNVQIKGKFIEDSINFAVEKCYSDNFFRKSVVENAVFNRKNTNTNTPVIIYTSFMPGEEIDIKVLIKGAGSENKSKLEMLLPTSSYEEIIKTCSDLILDSGVNACPPMFIGIGIGAVSDKACVLSKEALLCKNFTAEEIKLAKEIKDFVNSNAPSEYKNIYVLDVKVKTSPTHIACLPIAVTVNCHSKRFGEAVIKKNSIIYAQKIPKFKEFDIDNFDCREIFSEDINSIREIKSGEKILLTGELFVARDMAHKRIVQMMKDGSSLPFDLKNKIIFYAGPCPAKTGEICGSIGPTTSSRMDKYAAEFYNNGLLASIGKGSRSLQTKEIIEKAKGKYFTIQGGIAALLAEKIKSKEVIAFEDLGAEAVFKIYAEKLPLTCVI